MDLLNFFNRKTKISPEFKSEAIQVIIPFYLPHMKDLIRNILFRLETTEFKNSLILLFQDETKEVVFELQEAFSGYFSTDILVTSATSLNATKRNIPTVFIIDNNSKNLFGNSTKSLKVICQSFKSTYFIELDSYLNSATIHLYQGIKNDFTDDMLFNNYKKGLDKSELVAINYPIVASKAFNIFNQIVSEGMEVYQTFEIINLDNMSSENSFGMSEGSVLNKYIKKESSYFNVVADWLENNKSEDLDNPIVNMDIQKKIKYLEEYALLLDGILDSSKIKTRREKDVLILKKKGLKKAENREYIQKIDLKLDEIKEHTLINSSLTFALGEIRKNIDSSLVRNTNDEHLQTFFTESFIIDLCCIFNSILENE